MTIEELHKLMSETREDGLHNFDPSKNMVVKTPFYYYYFDYDVVAEVSSLVLHDNDTEVHLASNSINRTNIAKAWEFLQGLVWNIVIY